MYHYRFKFEFFHNNIYNIMDTDILEVMPVKTCKTTPFTNKMLCSMFTCFFCKITAVNLCVFY